MQAVAAAATGTARRRASSSTGGCGHDHSHDCGGGGSGGPKWSPQALGGQAGPWEVDLSGEAAAAQQGARGVLQVAGPDAPKLLQGLVTNDVLHLPVAASPGEQQQQQGAMAAAFLTNKGK